MEIFWVGSKQQDNEELSAHIKAEEMEDFVLDFSSTGRDPCLRTKLESVQTRFLISVMVE
jgi:hypothetical protein